MSTAQTTPDGVHLWLVLWKACKAMEKFASRDIESYGMCRTDFALLEALLHKGPLPVNTLGAKVLLTSGSITTAVDRLEKRGLVERKNNAEDRRARIVHLTPEGCKLIQKLFAQHRRAMEDAAAALSPAQRAVLIDLLKTLGKSVS